MKRAVGFHGVSVHFSVWDVLSYVNEFSLFFLLVLSHILSQNMGSVGGSIPGWDFECWLGDGSEEAISILITLSHSLVRWLIYVIE